MPVRINPSAEPLSFAARTDTPPHPGGKPPPATVLARSQAGDLLEHEMERYCDGLVRGRSFLVAGHRGSGKTTLVDRAVLNLQHQALARQLRFKPLPVYIQGPLIFNANESADAQDDDAASLQPLTLQPPPPEPSPDEEEGRQLANLLVLVAHALHQAVAREFVERFHLHARNRHAAQAPEADELAELAANFQIELTEAPPAHRMLEYMERAGLMKSGVLFGADNGRGPQQGWRELVLLAGVTHVYQRVSGQLKVEDKDRGGQSRSGESTTGLDAKWAELVKPLTAVAAGGAVAVAGAEAAGGNPMWAAAMGLLTALGTGLLFKITATQKRERERTFDRTFFPDLKIRTLHRVMPELFERLQAAGLAPVFIVDELDKVDDLYVRLQSLMNNLKKLFAERAFTCLVVERGFYEELHWREELERQGGSAAPAGPGGGGGGP